METGSRARYKITRDQLNAMKTSTTSAEFSTALLAFLTFGRSVLHVARSEAARHGVRQPMKHRIEAAEEEPLSLYYENIISSAALRLAAVPANSNAAFPPGLLPNLRRGP